MLPVPRFDIGIYRALFIKIVREQLDVVLVIVDTEGTLKERLQAISFDSDSRPACGRPSPLARSYQCATSKDFVLMALDGLRVC